jgi:hypothetical protein
MHNPELAPPDRELESALSLFARRYGATSPVDAMRRACDQVLGATGSADAAPPLDRLLAATGARCLVADTAQRAGLSIDAQGYVVTVRPGHLGKNHFPIAHEIGHILLFEGLADQPAALERLAQGRTDRPVERLCDFAASQLLMPSAAFKSEVLRSPLTFRHVVELTERYTTSLASVLVRFTQIFPGLATATLASVGVNGDEASGPYSVAVYGRVRGLALPRTLGESALRPNLLRTARKHGLRAHGKVVISRRPWKAITTRATVLRFERSQTQQEHLRMDGDEHIVTRRNRIQYLLLYQRADTLVEGFDATR